MSALERLPALFGLDSQEASSAYVSSSQRMKFPCLTRLKITHLIRRAPNRASGGVEEPETDSYDMSAHAAHVDQCPHYFISAGRHVALDAIRCYAYMLPGRFASKRGR